jgi:hypothetical protein
MLTGIFARLGDFPVLVLPVSVLLAAAPRVHAYDAFVLNRHLPSLHSLEARAHTLSAAATEAVTTEPVCDIFANGYEQTGATPCAGCFDGTIDFDETDIDCGGTDCKACADGQQCIADSDCQSAKCTNNVCTDVLLISQVQTRGDNGGNDEFVELYNPGAAAVTFDASWSLLSRSAFGTCTGNTLAPRFTGAGEVIPAHGHVLYVNSSGYNGATTGDATYSIGIVDASSVVLEHTGTVVDALCFYYDATTLSALSSCSIAYICEGIPVRNLHDNTGSTNTDSSLERRPGGSLGNMTDTGDNASDFLANPSADPHNLSSGPTP